MTALAPSFSNAQASDAAIQPRAKRIRVAGTTHQKTGAAWSGAHVVLYSAPTLPIPQAELPDTVLADSDAHGRFVVRLLAGRRYAAWAWAAGEHGGDRVARVVPHALANESIELLEREGTSPRLRLRIFGASAWHAHGAAVVYAIDTLGRVHTPRPTANGFVDLPPLPGDAAIIEVRVAGVPVVYQRLATRWPERREARAALIASRELAVQKPVPGLPDLTKLADPSAELTWVVMGPPRTLRFEIRDLSGAPIEAAEVGIRSRATDFVTRLATSDAKGEAIVVLPTPIDAWGRRSVDRRIDFQVVAPGHALTRVRHEVGEVDTDPIEVTLRQGQSIRGRVRGTTAVPTKDLLLLARITRLVHALGGRASAVSRTAVVRVGEDGAWQIDGLDPRASVWQIVVLVPAHTLAPTLVQLPWAEGSAGDGLTRDVTCPAFDLTQVRRVALRLHYEDGSPARFARVRAFPNTNALSADARFEPRFLSDRLGRCVVWTTNREPTLAVLAKDGWLIRKLGRKHAAARWTLAPFRVCTGTVRTRDGHPALGARVAGHPLPSANAARSRPVRWIHEQTLQTFTGIDGRYRLRWLPLDGFRMRVTAHKRIAGHLAHNTRKGILGPTTSQTLDLTLDR